MKKPGAAAIAIAALSIAALIFNYCYLIENSAPFSWDEAHHSFFSLLIARSLAAVDPGAFWRHTHSQVYWPFMQSWLTSPFLLIGGYNYASSRLAAAFFGAISVFLLYLVGRRLFTTAVGVLAAALLAISPMFHVLSSTAMAENIGLFLVLSLVLFLAGAWRRGGRALSLASGALLAALFLTKYIYGAFFGTALAAFLASLAFFRAEGLDRKRVFASLPWLAAGFLLVWGPWVLVPPTSDKLGMFFFRVGDTGGWNPFGYSRLDNRLFFVRALYYAYGYSAATYLLYLAGIAFGFARLRAAKTRFLLFLFLANVVPMSMIVNSQERFIYLGFPFLLLLSAAATVWAWKRFPAGWRWGTAALLAVFALGDLHKLPSYYRQATNAVLSFNLHRQELRLDYSTLFGLASAPRFIRYPKDYFNPAAPDAMPHDTREVVEFVKSTIDTLHPLCVPAWLGTLPPHLWHWEFGLAGRPAVTFWHPGAVYFLLIDVGEDSPYNRLGNRHLIEGLRRWSARLERWEEEGLVRKAAERRFDGLGLTARIFVRLVPSDHPSWPPPGASL